MPSRIKYLYFRSQVYRISQGNVKRDDGVGLANTWTLKLVTEVSRL